MTTDYTSWWDRCGNSSHPDGCEHRREESMIDRTKKVTPSPGAHIQAVASELAETLARKNKDYAPTDEFSNFRLAGELAGLTAWDAILIQIGIKYTRLMNLVSEGVAKPEYESVHDTLKDLAGYAVIAAAYLRKEQADGAA